MTPLTLITLSRAHVYARTTNCSLSCNMGSVIPSGEWDMRQNALVIKRNLLLASQACFFLFFKDRKHSHDSNGVESQQCFTIFSTKSSSNSMDMYETFRFTSSQSYPEFFLIGHSMNESQKNDNSIRIITDD